MKKAFAVILVALFLVSAVIPLLSPGSDAVVDTPVTGLIIDQKGEAVEGVTVTATPENPADAQEDKTDGDGKFDLTLDGSKNYHITFSGELDVIYCPLVFVEGKGYLWNHMDQVVDMTVFLGEADVPVTDVVVKGIIYIDAPETPVDIALRFITDGEDDVTTVTNPDGEFKVSLVNGKDYELIFWKGSYGVSHVSSNLELTNSKCTLKLTDNTLSTISVSAQMSLAYGKLKGTVQDEDGTGLGEVNVEVVDETGKVIANASTRNGVYEIENIPIGEYYVTISRSDIETQTVEKRINVGDNVQDFVAKSRINTYILGLDFPHSLMFGGVVIGFLVILIILGYRISLGRKAAMGVSVSDDEGVKEEEEF